MNSNKILTSLNDVPLYLTRGSLFESLSDIDSEFGDGSFMIDPIYFKNDTSVNSVDDLSHLLHSLDYWCINYFDYPSDDIFHIVFQNSHQPQLFDDIIQRFYYLEIINDFKTIFKISNSSFHTPVYIIDNDSPLLFIFLYNLERTSLSNISSYTNKKTFISQLSQKQLCSISANVAKKGYLNLLVHIHENNYPWNEETTYNAATYGHLDCLKYAHENGCPWKNMICYGAAKNGHLNCLKYAHENGCPWNEMTTFGAASNNLNCLKYAHENGCPWSELTPAYAANEGHIDCLKYAHENNCPWDEETTFNAANKGHIDCLKYAHENGCPWKNTVCSGAAKNGHLKCLKYAHENGCPWDHTTINTAIKYDNLSCLKYAHKNGCPLKNTRRIANENGSMKCIKYIRRYDLF